MPLISSCARIQRVTMNAAVVSHSTRIDVSNFITSRQPRRASTFAHPCRRTRALTRAHARARARTRTHLIHRTHRASLTRPRAIATVEMRASQSDAPSCRAQCLIHALAPRVRHRCAPPRRHPRASHASRVSSPTHPLCAASRPCPRRAVRARARVLQKFPMGRTFKAD